MGLLNPLALPSHVARETRSKYRDGVSVGRTNHARNHGQVATSRLIDVGMDRLVEIDALVPLGMRVTVDMTPSGPCYEAAGKYLFGNICDRHTPRVKDGLYWGYKVRTEKCLSDIFRNNVDEKTYDLTIGTSERGTNIYSRDVSFVLPVFERALVVFGGVHGLEQAVCEDEALHALGIRAGSKPHEEALQDETEKDKQVFDVGDLFDFYVNTCPQQGSRTIRSEEAIFISLAALSPFLIPRA